MNIGNGRGVGKERGEQKMGKGRGIGKEGRRTEAGLGIGRGRRGWERRGILEEEEERGRRGDR